MASVGFWRIPSGSAVRKEKVKYMQEKMTRYNSDYNVFEDSTGKAVEKSSKLKVVYMPTAASENLYNF